MPLKLARSRTLQCNMYMYVGNWAGLKMDVATSSLTALSENHLESDVHIAVHEIEKPQMLCIKVNVDRLQ